MITSSSEKLTWFGTYVKKIHDSDSRQIHFSKLIASFVLTISLVGIPLIAIYQKEVKRQTASLRDLDWKIQCFNTSILKRSEIVEKLGLKNLDEVPVLDLKGREGSTGYIDFLKPSDLTHPVMKGEDKHGRAFISLKMTHLNVPEFVVTFFQRHTDSPDTWVFGTSSTCKDVMGLIGGRVLKSEEGFSNLRKLIAGQEVKGFNNRNLMPDVYLKPTIAVTDFTKSHSADFGNKTMITSPSEKLTRFGKCVKKIHDSNSRLANFSKVIASFVLTISLIGIPFVVIYQREVKRQTASVRDLDRKIQCLNASILRRSEVVEKLGLNLDDVPLLDLKGRGGSTDYLDFLQPSDLTHSVMKGEDKHGRAFISLKVTHPNVSDEFVVTFFQRYTDITGTWVFGTSSTGNEVIDLIGERILKSEEGFSNLRELIAGQEVKGFNLA